MNEVESSCDHTVHPAEVTFVSTTIIVQKKCYKSVKILHTELLRFLKICIFYSMGGADNYLRLQKLRQNEKPNTDYT